jgi:hypothetical protein
MPRVVNRAQKATVRPIVAPIGGLNARDPLGAMPPTDASVLENMFPDSASVGTRKGHEVFADGTSLYVNDGIVPNKYFTRGFHGLMTYEAGSVSKLFANLIRRDSNTGSPDFEILIYEVATNGTLSLSHTINGTSGVPASTIGEYTMFVPGSATAYLFARFNDGSADVTRAFDGSSWTTPSITGLPTAGALGIHGHRHRLWFYGADLTAYYLPIAAIAGTVTAFQFGTLFSKGGRIVSMRTWTIDGGDGGSDDLLAVLTSSGQMALYTGTDPASSATWALVGIFDVGRPASPQFQPVASSLDAIRGGSFMLKFGADLLMVLSDGVMSASKILRPAPDDSSRTTRSAARSIR